MAKTGQRLSALVDRLPRYHIVKEKVYCPASRIHGVISEIARMFRGRDVDTGDGIRAEDKQGWVQVRASGTEPMLRVVAEDRSRERARQKVDEILRSLERLIP
jgi:phosphomannomutase